MKFTVYQINLSDEQEDNRDIREMYLDTIMQPTVDAIIKAREYYKPVADIITDDFDGVFEIGNLGPEERIFRKAPMHSVSVGDVIVREDGVTKFVAPFGFTSVAF
jgi:hypothetical protein